MSLSASPLSYEDCAQILTAALSDPAGARVHFTEENAAIFFRMRCNQARVIDRRANADTYPKGEPLHNTSAWDRLILRLRRDESGWWVYIEQNAVLPGKVESLSTGDQMELDLLPAPPRLLAPPKAPTEEEMGEAFEEIETVKEEPKTGGWRR